MEDAQILQCGHAGLLYLHMYIHAFACAPDTSEGNVWDRPHRSQGYAPVYPLEMCGTWGTAEGYNRIQEGLLHGLYLTYANTAYVTIVVLQ